MHIIRDLTEAHLANPSVVTIGTFDGLHLGHQALIDHLKGDASRHQAQTAVITFHPRPKTVLAPHLPNNDYLTTPEERLALFEALGIDLVVLTPFTLELAKTSAYDFVKLMVERLKMVGLCVGHDFDLGKNREGNVEKLTELGREFGYTVRQVMPLVLDDDIVSSTRIRRYLLEGNVRRAARLLGRYPALTSTIIQGAQRGRSIGFPTANFAVPAERILPANGVYATFIRRAGQSTRLPSVTNVGIRPSFDSKERTVETFIFDFDEDIYDQSFTLEFVERLRPEKKFENIGALVSQIGQDAEQARQLLAGEPSLG
jgi:riboflavin kinase/FMN adenylyltransferase